MTAEYKVHGDVAVITMMNPPVNGLGLSTRVGITDGLAKANQDAAVKAIVITGGAQPKVAIGYTHHAFVAEAFELNGQLEQVINHVRKHFPKLRVD